ncbi:mitochondrial ribosomal protein L11 [Lentinula edodes]|uniref:Mitochondrial ribosomal protein L11 n=1 Tax=Lentinula edodes TaxID=5353 RepID=A0A1Q3E3T7_LENED|nr:mitochondrial ribosomal protein L11 [Lentinula edodes]
MSKTAKAKDQVVRLLISAGKAAPTPPVGPALGARGVKSMDFCKEFNARTAHVEPGVPTPTLITIRPDRTFSFITKTPPTSYLLKKVTGIDKGPAKPGHETLATISLKHNGDRNCENSGGPSSSLSNWIRFEKPSIKYCSGCVSSSLAHIYLFADAFRKSFGPCRIPIELVSIENGLTCNSESAPLTTFNHQ